MYANRHRYEDDNTDYSCSGKSEGCPGCEGCEKSSISTRLVICRKARSGAKVGDLIKVTTGFTYQKGGPRLSYFRQVHVVGYGPNHPTEKIGTGQWFRREGGFLALYPEFAELMAAREAQAAEAKAQKAEADRKAAADRKVEADRKAAERQALILAPEGSVVTRDGAEFTVSKTYTKLVYHSNAEYYGHACDATAYSARKLTNVKTGETIEVIL